MKNMAQALDDVPIEEPARAALHQLFERSSAYLVNVGQAGAGQADAPADNGNGPSSGMHEELSRRWSAQRALDEAIAAVHEGAADRAIALSEGAILKTHFHSNRSVFAALLARMIGGGDDTMLGYVQEKVLADPVLAQERYSGRTLLHAAAAAGNVAMVELLLRAGAEPGVTDAGGHTPLYCVANECPTPGGAGVVRALVQAGADVDACDGVKHCTALHMAARRGNQRDRRGSVGLRRGHRGARHLATPRSAVPSIVIRSRSPLCSWREARTGMRRESKRLTPVMAARTAAMRRLFESGNRE